MGDVRVKLIAYTPEPLKTIAKATLVSYWDEWSLDNIDKITEKDAEMHLPKVLSYGHESVLEHVVLTFAVEGVSIVTLKQITRHRHMSFTVRSQRYISLGRDDKFIIPPSIIEITKKYERWLNEDYDEFEEDIDDELYDIIGPDGVTYDEIEKFLKESLDLYERLVSMGVPKEDARFFIPQAIETKFVVTMNMREFKHFIGLRLCERAQWEIRELARKMWEEVYKVEELRPLLKWAKIGPKCIQLGYCNEGELMPPGCLQRQRKWWREVWNSDENEH